MTFHSEWETTTSVSECVANACLAKPNFSVTSGIDFQRMQTRRYPGQNVVRAVGVEPTWALKPCGFSYRLRLSPPNVRALALRRICGLDYPFTLLRRGG